MFKSSSIPQRPKFSLTRQEFIDDIEAVYRNEEQRNKLYLCLDEAPPKEHKFDKIEEFLKGTQDLEKSLNMLNSLKREMEELEREVNGRVSDLREKAVGALK